MADKNSKLIEDEEESAADDEPMGSVAAAVPRDRGSSVTEHSEPPKPPAKHPEPKPKKP